MAAFTSAPSLTPAFSSASLTKSASTASSRKAKSYSNAETEVSEKVQAYENSLTRDAIRELIKDDAKRMFVYDRILDTSLYQGIVGLCTAVSIYFLVAETDLRAQGESMPRSFRVAGLVLTCVFGVDIVSRLYVVRLEFFSGPINILEASLVALDVVLEVWDSIPNLLSALKVIRFLRLMRLLRTASQTRDLYLMMVGMISSVRCLLFGTIALVVIMTVYSTLTVYFVRPLCHQLDDDGVFGECDYCRNAFDSVAVSNLTLIMLIIGGDGWTKLAGPLIQRDMTSCVLISCAFVTVNLGLLNTIAAVVVDRQVQARESDSDFNASLHREELQKQLQELSDMFKEIDNGNGEDDGDGVLDRDELLEYYDTNAMFKTTLNRMDIHKSDVPVIFDILDLDESGTLSFPEFVSGVNNLKNQDVHTLAIFTKHYCERLHDMTQKAQNDNIEQVKENRRSQDALRESVGRIEQVLLRSLGQDVCHNHEIPTDHAKEEVRCGSSTCAAAEEDTAPRQHAAANGDSGREQVSLLVEIIENQRVNTGDSGAVANFGSSWSEPAGSPFFDAPARQMPLALETKLTGEQC